MASQFDAFAREYGISVEVEDADANPNMSDDKFAREASHYKVTVQKGSKSLTFHYSKGSALEYGVTAGEALEAIYNDVGSLRAYEGDTDYKGREMWKTWAHDLGYEWDEACEKISKARADDYGIDCDAYHKAKAAWKAGQKMTKDAKRTLGDDCLNELLALEAP